MLLNDPIITIDPVALNSDHLYKFYTDSYTVIDGFEKQGSPCMLVMNQPKI